MNLNTLLKKIFNSTELKNDPPVLIDVGASESMHKLWKKFSSFSICVAFDADDREIGYTEKITKEFKKLYVFNCIVTSDNTEQTDFYLTKSPYCSSTLEPQEDKLNDWAYAEKFNVIKKTKMNAKSLMQSLEEIQINKIDWFKSDSQGIDLRLFNSISNEIKKNIIVAEFEPGFIDSYKGEDKLSDLIKDFEEKKFWLSDITVKGSQRLTRDQLNSYFKFNSIKKLAQFSHKTSPGWAELIYIRNINADNYSAREFLLGWVFSTVLRQHGYALMLADNLIKKVKENDALFRLLKEMKRYSLKRIRRDILLLKFTPYALIKIKQLLGMK